MVKRILRVDRGIRSWDEAGFTLPEVMTAMAVSVIVLLANFALLNTANKNFAYTRALTNATNHATDKFAEFKTRLVTTQPASMVRERLTTRSSTWRFPRAARPASRGGR